MIPAPGVRGETRNVSRTSYPGRATIPSHEKTKREYEVKEVRSFCYHCPTRDQQSLVRKAEQNGVKYELGPKTQVKCKIWREKVEGIQPAPMKKAGEGQTLPRRQHFLPTGPTRGLSRHSGDQLQFRSGSHRRWAETSHICPKL